MEKVFLRIFKRPSEEGQKAFFYVDLGREAHGRASQRLWVSEKLVEFTEQKEPFCILTGHRFLKKTEKGNWVLKPQNPRRPTFVFLAGWECGYRGWSTVTVEGKGILNILRFEIWRSPRGNLGKSEYALICAEHPEISVLLERGGRLYGSPACKRVLLRAKPSGQEEITLEVPEDEELEEELS